VESDCQLAQFKSRCDQKWKAMPREMGQFLESGDQEGSFQLDRGHLNFGEEIVDW